MRGGGGVPNVAWLLRSESCLLEVPSKYTRLSGSGQVPLQCKPFFSVTYLPLCPFQQQLVTDPLGLDLL